MSDSLTEQLYDAVIIGAGLSGLAAGIRLAYFEKRVAILERHTTIGGLNSFYRLRGRNHDVGLHAVTNYAPPGTKKGPLSKLLRQLRLSWDDFGLCPQIESSVEFGDVVLTFDNTFERFRAQVAEVFPDQAGRFDRLVHRIQEHDALSLSNRYQSARAVVGEYLTDPLLVDMLFCPLMFYGSPTAEDMDFSQFVIMFKAVFCEGFARPEKGIRPILKTLVRRYRSLGGELHLRSGVRRLCHDGDRVTTIELDDGRQVRARNVLSSAGAVETFRLCEPPLMATLPVRPGEISFVETIFCLDCLPSDLGHHRTIVFYNDAPRFRYARPAAPVDLSSGIICSPNNFQYDHPPAEGRLRITALADPEFWLNAPEPEYRNQKRYWCERLVEAALRHVPDFRSHVVDVDMFTPRTITRFTGHVNGCVYGAPDKIRDGRTPLENLFLCGTDQGFLGIIGAMLSGITIANLHLLGQSPRSARLSSA